MDLPAIGGRIKAERKKLGISQEQLAEEVNVSMHYIYEIERGMKSMSLETLINICEALELSADYVLFGNRKGSQGSFYRKLDEMNTDRRIRAESAFEAILPYIR